MTERNYALIEKVWTWIKDHPRKHHQGMWLSTCGTAGCFAGWTTLLSGYEAWNHNSVRISPDDPNAKALAHDIPWFEQDTTVAPVGSLATVLLGLENEDAGRLFNASNSRPMLELMVKDLMNGDTLQEPTYYRKLRMEQLKKERNA